MANRFLNNIRINDEYTLPPADGTADQVISTDGAGNLSFVDATTLVTTAESNFVYYDVKNSSGATINKGKAVMAVGTDGNSGHILIDEIVADGSVESKYFIGVLETTLDNGDIGRVIHFGELDQFNTLGQNGETWSDGDILWLDPSNNGDYTITEPNGPNLKVAAAIVKNAATNGKIQIRVQANEGVHDLHDVNLGTLGEGDLLNYDSALSVWKNSGQSTTAAQMPSGTTAQRPTGTAGMFRFNSEDSQFEGYDGTQWGAIAGSGGGSGTVTIQKNVYTGNNSTVSFNTSTSIVDENNVQVYIDGVYQSKDNYTTSGSTVTFSTAPPSNTSVELIHMVAVSGVIARDSFTGDASTVAYILSMSITNENATQVYIDGVYQSKDNYTTLGSVLTFSTAPPNGAAIEVVHIKAVDASSLNQNSFTGNGVTTDFTLSQSIDDAAKTFVFIQGVYQEKSTYSISGSTISFTVAPQNGYTIEVMAFSSVTITNEPKYNVSVISANTNAVRNTLYILTANLTLTLPASPSDGDSIKVSNRSGVATCVIARNGENIMGAASDLTIDKLNSGFELIYAGSAQGWVLIGVPGQ